MLDIDQIRQAIAAQIQINLETEVNVYEGRLPNAPSPPCVLIAPDRAFITYANTFGPPAIATVRWRIGIYIPVGPDTDGQITLAGFLSSGSTAPNSVYDALNRDDTFGGVVESFTAVTVEYLDRLSFGEQVVCDVAELVVDVMASADA